MSNVNICDICGKRARDYRFEHVAYHWYRDFFGNKRLEKYDVCYVCWDELKELRKSNKVK